MDTQRKEALRPAKATSERHADILNGYKQGGSRFNDWTRAHLGDIRLASWEWGKASLVWRIDDRFVMPDGVTFGGHIAAVADHVAALATMTVLSDSAERFRTSRLSTDFFRPILRPIARIEARVVNVSARLIHAEAEFFNGEDKLAARVSAVQVRRREE